MMRKSENHLGLTKQILRVLFIAWLIFGTSAAWADQVVVRRPVTVRSEPNRHSSVVTFPQVGQSLTLLNEDPRRGYYHVRLEDGRTGWVYGTFVSRTRELAATGRGADQDTATVHFIDVDQANSALLEFPCAAVLIDAGARDAAGIDHLISYLEAFFARRTDLGRHLAAVFITHTHVDHNRALRRVAETFHVDAYIHNGILTGSGRTNATWMNSYVQNHLPPIPNEGVEESAVGPQGRTDPIIDPVKCPRVDPDIRVLSGRYSDNPGWSDGDFDNGNNHSLVIRMAYGGAKFLFTGDLEEPAIETLLEHTSFVPLLDADVYLVGHHGSNNGTTPALLSAMTPQIAVFSMGNPATHVQWTAWAYGHPRRSTVVMIDHVIHRKRSPATDVQVADGAKKFSVFHLTHALYATGWDGDVRITARPDGELRVQTTR
jgi:competence protein ComEC